VIRSFKSLRTQPASTTTLVVVSLLAAALGLGCGAEEALAGSDAGSVFTPRGDGAVPVGLDASVPSLLPGMDGGSSPSAPVPSGPCTSTWEAVRRSIFTAHRCTASNCHGSMAPAGGLDLTGDQAYDHLVFQNAQASLAKPMSRVFPGEERLSFLYLKLAAASDPSVLPPGGGAPMPTGSAALSADELAGLRLWIRAGAPREGVVAGTQDLLDCSQPAQGTPNKSPRPPAPEPSKGFQLRSGPWDLGPGGENEVCFGTYYDLTDVAPEWARTPCTIGGVKQTCVAYDHRQLVQDAQSHHSILRIYGGSTPPTDPTFGKWRCAGTGDQVGVACNPMSLGVPASAGGGDCGANAVCQTEPTKSFLCIGWGPSDRTGASVLAGGSQAPVSTSEYPEGVYAVIPIKGVVTWDSHGFNLTNEATSIEQYLSFQYAMKEDQRSEMVQIFDASRVFSMSIPAYQQLEMCNTYVLPQYARLHELSSHVHKRGILWRSWLPPNTPDCRPEAGCAPNPGAPDQISKVYNDAVVTRYTPALTFDGADPASRTIKYCSLFDNGKEKPDLLKRRSQLPEGATDCGIFDLYCYGGTNPGAACFGIDGLCQGGGKCDACTVLGGETTADEMFLLLGEYYLEPTTP